MSPSQPPRIKTIEQALDYVHQIRVCGIFGSKDSALPTLWDAVDLPHRSGGRTKWGARLEAVWAWKNELPAMFPDEIFYGKLPDGLAMLMTLDHLREVHYPAHHRAVSECSSLARRAYEWIRREPHTTGELRKALSPSGQISKSRLDAALVELQATLNITRSNAPNLKVDTWLPFAEQYPDIAGIL